MQQLMQTTGISDPPSRNEQTVADPDALIWELSKQAQIFVGALTIKGNCIHEHLGLQIVVLYKSNHRTLLLYRNSLCAELTSSSHHAYVSTSITMARPPQIDHDTPPSYTHAHQGPR
jgi:hypothetical protein